MWYTANNVRLGMRIATPTGTQAITEIVRNGQRFKFRTPSGYELDAYATVAIFVHTS